MKVLASQLAIALVFLLDCSLDREKRCEEGQVETCIRDGAIGHCLAPGYCAFRDMSCDDQEGVRWDSTAREDLRGTCVNSDPINVGPDGGTVIPIDASFENTCGGNQNLTEQVGAVCGPCGAGTYVCDGPNALRCDGVPASPNSIASTGTVVASTEFTNVNPLKPDHTADRAIDDDRTTSWFSTGPEDNGLPTSFTWSGPQTCFREIVIKNNSLNEEEDFRNDFGFGQVTVKITGGSEEFTKGFPLPGTPDPEITINPDIRGNKIELLFIDHESENCGGFSELVVLGF